MINRIAILTESIWIASLIIISFIVDFLLLGQFSLFKGSMDFQLHDTYFVVNGWLWVLTLFILIVSPVYLVKEAFKKFELLLPNLILSLFLMILLFIVIQLHGYISNFVAWIHSLSTSDPMLSSQGSMVTTEIPLFNTANSIFKVIELVIIVGLFLIGMKTGVNSQEQNGKAKN